MPCDYSKYPPDWEERRQRILERSGNCCEFCGVENYAVGARDINGDWHDMDDIGHMSYEYGMRLFGDYPVLIKIILTIAHLDHDPENWDVSENRLAALCQRCHLQYDREHRKKEAEKHQLRLF